MTKVKPAALSVPPWWLRLRYRAEFGLLFLAEKIIPRLPLRLVRAAASGVGSLAWALDARGRRVIRENLRMALGGTHDEAQRRRIERENYRVFARTFMELFWGSRLLWDLFCRRIF